MARLEVARLPRQATFIPGSIDNGPRLNLRPTVHSFVHGISRLLPQADELPGEKLKERPVRPLGIVVARMEHDVYTHWNNPQRAIWLAYGEGAAAEQERLIAEAACMLRFTLRESRPSVEAARSSSDLLQDIVERPLRPDADGNYPWGDLIQGGAITVHTLGYALSCAVAGYDEDLDNDTAATALGKGLLNEIILAERRARG
jgi:hypothetical protein